MTLPALRAHCKALEDCLARANKDLRAAKKDLKLRNEQVTFHADHARKNAEDAQAMRELMKTLATRVSEELAEPKDDSMTFTDMFAMLEEWNRS
jgi:hypothetical protein